MKVFDLAPLPGSALRCNDGFASTSPAGHINPNAFGLHDMLAGRAAVHDGIRVALTVGN